MEATECGSVAFHDICIFGKHMALEKMRMETGVSRMAARPAIYAHASGTPNCRAYTKEPESLIKMQMPCIIHWRLKNHFIVLEGFRNGYV